MLYIIFLCLSINTYAQTPLKIGLSLSLSGKYEKMGKMQNNAYLLWEEEINKKGGLIDKTVEMIIYDDKSELEEAVKLYSKLIYEDKVDILIGPYSSEITIAVLPITKSAGYPLIIPGGTADEIWDKKDDNIEEKKNGAKNTLAFGLLPPASRYTVGFLELLLRADLSKIVILHSNDPFSTACASGAREWAQRFGLTVSLYAGFSKNTVGEYNTFAQNIKTLDEKEKISDTKENKPFIRGIEGVIICGYYEDGLKMREAFRDARWYPKAYYASVGPAFQDYYDDLGINAEGVFSSSHWEANSENHNERCENFIYEFLKEYQTEPTYNAAAAYAACQVIEIVITSNKSLDKEKFSDQLFKINEATVIGKLDFDKTGMQIRKYPYIIQWQQGRKEIVWPENLKTKDPFIE